VKVSHLISSEAIRTFVGQPEPGLPGAKHAVLGSVDGHTTYTRHVVLPLHEGASEYRCECGARRADHEQILVHMVTAPSAPSVTEVLS
jgi:hypothetical protein